jgi:hypothetical protein
MRGGPESRPISSSERIAVDMALISRCDRFAATPISSRNVSGETGSSLRGSSVTAGEVTVMSRRSRS